MYVAMFMTEKTSSPPPANSDPKRVFVPFFTQKLSYLAAHRRRRELERVGRPGAVVWSRHLSLSLSPGAQAAQPSLLLFLFTLSEANVPSCQRLLRNLSRLSKSRESRAKTGRSRVPSVEQGRSSFPLLSKGSRKRTPKRKSVANFQFKSRTPSFSSC